MVMGGMRMMMCTAGMVFFRYQTTAHFLTRRQIKKQYSKVKQHVTVSQEVELTKYLINKVD